MMMMINTKVIHKKILYKDDTHFWYLDVIQKHEPNDHVLTLNIRTRSTLNISLQFIRTYDSLPSLSAANILLMLIVPLSLLYLNPHAKRNDVSNIQQKSFWPPGVRRLSVRLWPTFTAEDVRVSCFVWRHEFGDSACKRGLQLTCFCSIEGNISSCHKWWKRSWRNDNNE